MGFNSFNTRRHKNRERNNTPISNQNSQLHNLNTTMPLNNAESEPFAGIFDKLQLTKLFIHTLREMGYANAAVTLQEESGGVQVESEAVQKLFRYITQGEFGKVTFDLIQEVSLRPVSAENALGLSAMTVEPITSTPSNGIEDHSAKFNVEDTLDRMAKEFSLFSQYYYTTEFNTKSLNKYRNKLEVMILVNMHFFTELIFAVNDMSTAVMFLRTTMRSYLYLWEEVLGALQSDILGNPSAFTPDRILRELSSFLTIPLIEEGDTLPRRIIYSGLWSGSVTASRLDLIDRISYYINPNDLVPQGRLIELLKQAVRFQRSGDNSALFNNVLDDEFGPGHLVNLLQDNISDYERIHFVEEHTFSLGLDEVWYMEFSPDGKYLAVAIADATSDRKVFIYDVHNNFLIYKVLKGNPQCVLYLSFSDDSRYLMTCPFNEKINIYDIHASGSQIQQTKKIYRVMSSGIGSRGSNLESNETSVNDCELIGPIDSFMVPASGSNIQNASQSSENADEVDADDATVPEENSDVYAGIEPMDLPRHPDLHTTVYDGTSHRVWCSDWFHTSKHKGKLVMGSPDRDIVIYDTETKSIIYSFSRDRPKSHSSSSRFDSSEENEEENEDEDEEEENIRSRPVWSNGLDDATATDEEFPRVHDIKITQDDKYLLVMTHQGRIDVLDISGLPSNDELTRSENASMSQFHFKFVSRIKLGYNITCISLAQPSRSQEKDTDDLVLVNLQHNEMQMWNFKENYLVQKFMGQTQKKFIIRSCFGFNNRLVACGSEDGKVYLWDRTKGNILGVINAHNSNVPSRSSTNDIKAYNNCNMVAWNLKDQSMFASGGDDGFVRIWRVIDE